MDRNTIVFLGNACKDEYYQTDAWPQLGTKKYVSALKEQLGGMVANAACVMAGYGERVYLLDLLGDNQDTDALIQDLENYCVNTQYVLRDPAVQNNKCIIFISEGEKVIFIVANNRPKLKINNQTKDILYHATYVYSTIPDLSNVENMKAVLEDLLLHGIKLAIDVEADHFKTNEEADDCFKYADIIFFNRTSFARYSGDSSPNKAYQRLFHYGVSYVVVTMDKDGCIVTTPQGQFSSATYDVPVIDTTGAGDTFNATFLYGTLCGWTLDKTMKYANAAASIAISKIGARAGVNSIETVKQFIQSQLFTHIQINQNGVTIDGGE